MTISVGIIGTSNIAEAHVGRLQRLEGVHVKTICSRTLERAREFASRHHLDGHTGLPKDVFEDPEIDAVVIATEPDRHLELAFPALAMGKHIMAEKPIDKSLDKAEEFQSQTEGYPGVINIVSQKRFDTILKSMKRRLDDGEDGAKLI